MSTKATIERRDTLSASEQHAAGDQTQVELREQVGGKRFVQAKRPVLATVPREQARSPVATSTGRNS